MAASVIDSRFSIVVVGVGVEGEVSGLISQLTDCCIALL